MNTQPFRLPPLSILKRRRITVLLLSLALTTSRLTAFDVVRDGLPKAELVLVSEANASQCLAADDLKRYIEAITGVTLDIVPTPTGHFENRIFVGESEHTRALGFDLTGVEQGGYKIVVEKNEVIVAGRDLLRGVPPYENRNPESVQAWQTRIGVKFPVPSISMERVLPNLGIRPNDDTGTWYAACDLLEQLGVRWYAPGELGTVIPPHADTLRFEPQHRVCTPHSAFRQLYIYTTGEETQRWLHRLRSGVSRMRSFNHTTWEVMAKDIRAEFPQILAHDQHGEVVGGQRGVPKLTDPIFRKLSMQYLRAVLDLLPGLESHALGMPDGLGAIDFEDSKHFSIGNTLENRFNNYVWDYWSWAADELAKTHPDRFLECAGYPPYFGPPDDPSLVRDNVSITLCYWTSWLTEPHRRKMILDTREAWWHLLKPDRLRVWDYFLFFFSGLEPRIPPFFTAALQKDMQALDGRCIGKFIEVKGDNGQITCPGIMHFLLYWQNRLFWDPNEDREAVLADYYVRYFGPAAEPMQGFYEFAEEAFCNPVPLHKRTVVSLSGHNEHYFEYLNRARAAVEPGSIYDRRIAQIEEEILPLRKMAASLERKGPSYWLQQPPLGLKPEALDADPAKYDYGWVPLKDLTTGEAILRDKTDVVIRRGENVLYVLAVCHKNDMQDLNATCETNDDVAIFNDEVLEVYVSTPEHSFFKIVVNPNGAVYDESTDPEIVQRNNSMPIFWTPGTRVAVQKLEDRWIVEMAIPTGDFGALGPTKEYTWGIQVGRTRWSHGQASNQALAPTGGRYDETGRWGNLWAR